MALRPPPRALLSRALPCVRCQAALEPSQLLRRPYSSSRRSVPVPPRSRRPAQLLTALGAVAALVVVLAPRPSQPPDPQQSAAQSSAASSSRAGSAPPPPPRLEPERFQTFRLRSRELGNSTLGSLSAGSEAAPSDGAHVLLRVPVSPAAAAPGGALGILTLHLAHPFLSVQRAYTPLYAAPLLRSGEGGGDATLLIKRYADGEVGRYAHELREGDEVLLRGPEYSWKARGDERDLLLIAGGTGLTPMYQLLTTLLGSPSAPHSASPAGAAPPRLTLLYGTSRPDSLLLLPELAALRARHPQLDVRLFVEDAPRQGWWGWATRRQQSTHGMPLRKGRVSERDVNEVRREEQDVLVCGPDGMVAAVAGRKARDGRGQGELGGILQRLGYSKERVHKL